MQTFKLLLGKYCALQPIIISYTVHSGILTGPYLALMFKCSKYKDIPENNIRERILSIVHLYHHSTL